MRFANSHLKQQGIKDNKFECRTHFNCRLNADKYYMHYSNGVYMGGITSYKRNGQGMVLLDDGTFGLTHYCFDTMVGHNVIFRKNAILSILYTQNQHHEVVYRISNFVLKVPFYQDQKNSNGNGLLIDYQEKKIYHLLFRHGELTNKILQTDKKIINSVFIHKSIKSLLHQNHEEAFKFNLKTQNGVKTMKDRNRIIVGFIEGKLLEGLGFKLDLNDQYDDFEVPFQLKVKQRGFYRRGRLQNFGERHFNNGNLYVGEFDNDEFNGKGVLIYLKQLKWVFGEFQDGNLKKMLNMNTGLNEGYSHEKLNESLLQIHEYNTKNWMSIVLHLVYWSLYIETLDKALKSEITEVKIEQAKVRRESKERLQKIENFFKRNDHVQSIDETMTEHLNKSLQKHKKVTLNEGGLMKPYTIQVENAQKSINYFDNQYYPLITESSFRSNSVKLNQNSPVRSNQRYLQKAQELNFETRASEYKRTRPKEVDIKNRLNKTLQDEFYSQEQIIN